MRSRVSRIVPVAVLALFAARCADGTLPPPQSMSDPANPRAPETPYAAPTSPQPSASASASASPQPGAVPSGSHQHGDHR